MLGKLKQDNPCQWLVSNSRETQKFGISTGSQKLLRTFYHSRLLGLVLSRLECSRMLRNGSVNVHVLRLNACTVTALAHSPARIVSIFDEAKASVVANIAVLDGRLRSRYRLLILFPAVLEIGTRCFVVVFNGLYHPTSAITWSNLTERPCLQLNLTAWHRRAE